MVFVDSKESDVDIDSLFFVRELIAFIDLNLVVELIAVFHDALGNPVGPSVPVDVLCEGLNASLGHTLDSVLTTQWS